MNRLLVIAAHPAEIAHLPAGTDVVLTGIGMSLAAAVTTQAVLERVPDPEDRAGLTVLNLGSCGALKPGADGLFEPSTVINRDVDADLMRAIGSDPADTIPLAEMGQTGDGSVLATGDSFVAGGPAKEALALRADLVDMEGFAVAVACRCLGMPLRMVKHVSDDADIQALAWADRVDISARALAEWFREHSQSLVGTASEPADQRASEGERSA